MIKRVFSPYVILACIMAGLFIGPGFSVASQLHAENKGERVEKLDPSDHTETDICEPKEDLTPAEELHHAAEELGKTLPLWTAIPFAGILLSIALFPLFAPHFWHHNYPKVALFWGLLFGLPFLFVKHSLALYEILHIYLLDYIPFIILLLGLFTVSGGIYLRGTLKGTPAVNTLMITIGTILASWMGTTGASMLLIRPLLRANKERKFKVHVIVFFIFLVSNVGGALTPLGDPPLFLGFLHGIPFFWTFHLISEMSFVAVLLLVIFFVYDSIMYRREENLPEQSGEKEPLKLMGIHNFLFLLGIMAGVLISGFWKTDLAVTVFHIHIPVPSLVRDGLILLMAYLSIRTTDASIHKDNEFGWEPIREVAFLFAGIFVTIIPALAILKAGEEGALGGLIRAINEPWHYFWATGALSSFLDNAPTYLTFFNTALGKLGLSESDVSLFLSQGAAAVQHVQPEVLERFEHFLKAVSTGAVFMGAVTYIGNAPNFMVRSISEESGVTMPSFFGYMAKFSIPFLIIVFVITTFVFF